MLAVAKREKEGWLDTNSIDNFPCEDLRTIDQLWVKYSDGKFGFSVQKRIYQGLGGTTEYDDKIWQAFQDKVGWNNYRLRYKMIRLMQVPIAYLPFPPKHTINFDTYLVIWDWDWVSSLTSRLVNCNI